MTWSGATMNENKLIVYPVPEGITVRNDFEIYVRSIGTDDWK